MGIATWYQDRARFGSNAYISDGGAIRNLANNGLMRSVYSSRRRTRWADQVQWCSSMQPNAEQPIEAGKVVKSPRSNSSARRPNRKSMNSPGSENGSLTRPG